MNLWVEITSRHAIIAIYFSHLSSCLKIYVDLFFGASWDAEKKIVSCTNNFR